METKKDLEIKSLSEDLDFSFASLEQVVKKPIKNKDVYLKQLRLRKEFIDWTKDKFLLLRGSAPKHVYKRDIFYCKLGVNVGSEQKLKRPVVVLQNNRGNASSETTIVAPVTTHNSCVIYEDKGLKYYKFLDSDGKEIIKKLDYYEVPLELEPFSKKNITGYINLAQIRTISKKRLSKGFVGKITIENDEIIKAAVIKLLFG